MSEGTGPYTVKMSAKDKFIWVGKLPTYVVKNKDHPLFALVPFREASCKCPISLDEALTVMADFLSNEDDYGDLCSDWEKIKGPNVTLRSLFKFWWPRLVRDGFLLPAKHDECEECREWAERSKRLAEESEDEEAVPEPAPAVEEAGPPQEAPKPAEEAPEPAEEAPKPARRVFKLKKTSPASSE